MVDRPPTLRELAEDPVFRTYLKTPPVLPENLRWGQPWRLWVEVPHPSKRDRTRTKWVTGKFPTYSSAWNRGLKAIRHPNTLDICVVSARYFFAPPVIESRTGRNKITKKVMTRDTHWLPVPPFEWCWRCRRPTLFVYLPPNHHSLRYQPTVSPESPHRCFFCGIRRVAMPTVKLHTLREG